MNYEYKTKYRHKRTGNVYFIVTATTIPIKVNGQWHHEARVTYCDMQEQCKVYERFESDFQENFEWVNE